MNHADQPPFTSLRPVRICVGGDAFEDYPGLTTPVRGLAVVRLGDDDTARLSLTHVASGFAVGFWPPGGTEAMARYVLEALAPLGCDWTMGRENFLLHVLHDHPFGLPHPSGWGGSASRASMDFWEPLDGGADAVPFEDTWIHLEVTDNWWIPAEEPRDWWVGLDEPVDDHWTECDKRG